MEAALSKTFAYILSYSGDGWLPDTSASNIYAGNRKKYEGCIA